MTWWTATSRTKVSPTCSRRSLSINSNFRRRVARYLGWSPLPIQPRRLTGGQWEQGHGVVLHVPGDGCYYFIGEIPLPLHGSAVILHEDLFWRDPITIFMVLLWSSTINFGEIPTPFHGIAVILLKHLFCRDPITISIVLLWIATDIIQILQGQFLVYICTVHSRHT